MSRITALVYKEARRVPGVFECETLATSRPTSRAGQLCWSKLFLDTGKGRASGNKEKHRIPLKQKFLTEIITRAARLKLCTDYIVVYEKCGTTIDINIAVLHFKPTWS
jgi:hypothetical protein